MSNLIKKSLDDDLMILDNIIGDCSIPERDWESIINIYNQNNKPFQIPAPICSNIILQIKDGRIPKMVFQSYGISYPKFKDRFNKIKLQLEEFSGKDTVSDEEWLMIENYLIHPIFILGCDIERASAFHFNEATDTLKKQSRQNAQSWLAYMKEIHKEEFVEKEDKKGFEVVINFGPGILDSI